MSTKDTSEFLDVCVLFSSMHNSLLYSLDTVCFWTACITAYSSCRTAWLGQLEDSSDLPFANVLDAFQGLK